MSPDSVRTSTEAAIAERLTGLFEEYVGRRPDRASSYVEEDLVLVILENALTKGEQVLAGDDRPALVQEMRRTFVSTMRDRFREVVEHETGRRVQAMLGDQSVLPDFALAAFILEPDSNGAGPPAPAPAGEYAGRPTAEQGEISRRFTALYKESVGRGPTDVRTYLTDGIVAVLLTGTLTKVERTLADDSASISVEEMRRQFQSAIRDRAKQLVEEVTGREVVAFMSDHSIEPDYALEILLLDGERWGEAGA